MSGNGALLRAGSALHDLLVQLLVHGVDRAVDLGARPAPDVIAPAAGFAFSSAALGEYDAAMAGIEALLARSGVSSGETEIGLSFSASRVHYIEGVDYLGFGEAEWDTSDVSGEGFSRGVEGFGPGRFKWSERPEAARKHNRFAVVVNLMSLAHNRRVRIRCFAPLPAQKAHRLTCCSWQRPELRECGP